MKVACRRTLSSAVLMVILVACRGLEVPTATLVPIGVAGTSAPAVVVSTSTPTSRVTTERDGLSKEQVLTLRSLEKVDDFPLYTMRYQGGYDGQVSSREAKELFGSVSRAEVAPAWDCSLFAALGDSDNRLYGRNFDWTFSPALLLFTDPPDRYSSVSMVDIAYLVDDNRVSGLMDLPIPERQGLLQAPYWPFDGMNEHGLAVGMAAVPPGQMTPEPSKESTGSLGIIRLLLDRARDVDEAVSIVASHNIDMTGGPPLHYLVADRAGRSVLIEFYQGEMKVIPNREPWHLATNFLRSSLGDGGEASCWRYKRMGQGLDQAEGRLSASEAMDLLSQVAQNNTQWSVVYGLSTGEIQVVLGREYSNPYTVHLPLTAGAWH